MELCHIAFFSCSASNSDDFLVVKNVLHQLTAGAIHDTPFYRLVRTNPGLLTISHIIMYAFYLYWLYGISGMVLLRKKWRNGLEPTQEVPIDHAVCHTGPYLPISSIALYTVPFAGKYIMNINFDLKSPLQFN